MTTNRRELCMALAALGALSTARGEAQTSHGAEPRLTHSELFPFDTLKPKIAANGMESRPVVQGTLATGEFVEVHESTLPPGEMPHPPHRHTHSEFLLIRDGKLEVVSDGQTGVIGPGGIIFTASSVLHSLKNIGDKPAHYFVVAIGLQKSIA